LTQILDDCVPDEVAHLSAADLAAIIDRFWCWGAEPLVTGLGLRLHPASNPEGGALGVDLLEIIQPDAPFLVDSIMGELADGGFSVQAMFHPVVEVWRDGLGHRLSDAAAAASPGAVKRRESMILVLLDPVGEDRSQALALAVRAALADVRLAVADFKPMVSLMGRSIAELAADQGAMPAEEKAETLAFLRWLEADHFVFLGARVYEYPRRPDGDYAAEEPLIHSEGSLGVLRDESRSVLRRANEPAILSAQLRRHLETGEALTVAKSNLRSRVHRRAYMDYVGIKRFGADGKASGEVRFVGLFTAEAYDQSARDVPLIRRKVEQVMAQADRAAGSHSEKRLRNIVETYPRDELFQIGLEELTQTALGILHLHDRPRVRLFVRQDPFDRFLSALLYVPRERYDSRVREQAGQALARAFGGRLSAYYPSFSDAPLARVHYIIGFTPGQQLKPDLRQLEAEIVQIARTWDDRFESAVRQGGVAAGSVADIIGRYAGGFPAGYRDLYDAEEALSDVTVLESLAPDETLRLRAYRTPADTALQFRFKLYRPQTSVPLADVLPVLEHMGLKALFEAGFPIDRHGVDTASSRIWVHEFVLEDPHGAHIVLNDIRAAFEAAFVAVWTGRTESDGFNRLVLELGVSWREAALIRALARYRQQSGLDPSQAVQEAALRDNPGIARLLLDLFRTLFDPAVCAEPAARQVQAAEIFAEILEALQAVESLDADRVLRRLAQLVMALKRTNYYQNAEDGGPKAYIAFKIASRDLDDLPAPKPFREIFVWATHVEGIHLRFGPVARGGLRWSDRRDDFRTEVLGLVKAQQVKNAVIVPVGSKGGFYPKALPKGPADAVRTEAVRAYKTFLYGLLDLTDNLAADGTVIPPQGVVIHDEDDPYLVVAADKGTATFSDIANGVAEDYGFWLGDAFASGGSAGYDHKVMGITARGAWEAVKRHFHEMGKDIQTQPFTVIGVGDMSGDVFGNGMLLSHQTRLLAAFDHRHIFIDPDPDPAASWAERSRMFALPRSSWEDYDPALISPGGGIFARSLKSVPLSPQIKALIGTQAEAMAPNDLIRALLQCPHELLYLGGIGTYVKAPFESHAEVGDKGSDAVRVNADQLGCKVIGEGANLGLTQAARILFAQRGGRINTDAIDNSAGVDSSDHEVNIKILTGAAERAGRLDRTDRNRLLASMTDEVADHVLKHNIGQTLALSLQEAAAPADLNNHGRFMTALEGRGHLDRKVETLPSTTVLAERAKAGLGLTRPELAVIMAYGKLQLSQDIVASSAPDDPYFAATLEAYFPHPLMRFEAEMRQHRLRREIVATVLANEMVNLVGPTFPSRLMAATGGDVGAMVRAFEAARAIFRLDEAWQETAALGVAIPATTQLALFAEIALVLRRQTFWLTRRAVRGHGRVQDLIDAYRPAADALREEGFALLSAFERDAAHQRMAHLVEAGAPEALARTVAALRPMTATSDVADLARGKGWSWTCAARLYHQVGARFGFDRLRAAAGSVPASDPYDRMAVRRLIEDLLTEQASLTRSVIAFAVHEEAAETARAAATTLASWTALRLESVQAAEQAINGIEATGAPWTFAKLTIANAALRQVLASEA
jgi:glutamate dehydrogenase